MSDDGSVLKGDSQRLLWSFVHQLEAIDASKANLGGKAKEIYELAEKEGFSKKALKRLIARRKLDREEEDRIDALVAVFEEALDRFENTPLGKFAGDIERQRKAIEEDAPTFAEKVDRLHGLVDDALVGLFLSMGKPDELTDDEKAQGFAAAIFLESGERQLLHKSGNMPAKPRPPEDHPDPDAENEPPPPDQPTKH